MCDQLQEALDRGKAASVVGLGRRGVGGISDHRRERKVLSQSLAVLEGMSITA